MTIVMVEMLSLWSSSEAAYRSWRYVIDRNYRGMLGVILFNHSSMYFSTIKGDRIMQLICERIVKTNLEGQIIFR